MSKPLTPAQMADTAVSTTPPGVEQHLMDAPNMAYVFLIPCGILMGLMLLFGGTRLWAAWGIYGRWKAANYLCLIASVSVPNVMKHTMWFAIC